MPRSAVTFKGQVTIPKEIRDQMGLRCGDRIDFVSDRPELISLKATHTDFRSLRGIIQSPFHRPITLKEEDEAIARGAIG